jgi:hypothetical protein
MKVFGVVGLETRRRPRLARTSSPASTGADTSPRSSRSTTMSISIKGGKDTPAPRGGYSPSYRSDTRNYVLRRSPGEKRYRQSRRRRPQVAGLLDQLADDGFDYVIVEGFWRANIPTVLVSEEPAEEIGRTIIRPTSPHSPEFSKPVLSQGRRSRWLRYPPSHPTTAPPSGCQLRSHPSHLRLSTTCPGIRVRRCRLD